MDALINAAARALANGDVLGALQHVALRDDAPALALRGIAMAQLGELDRARVLLRRAARRFGEREVVARDRCAVAEAEVALALRELRSPPRALAAAAERLARRGDHANAQQARLIAVRRLLLLGRIDEAHAALDDVDRQRLPAALLAVAELAAAEIALRRLQTTAAQAALGRARLAAARARQPALQGEVEDAGRALEHTAARCRQHGQERPLRLAEVEALHGSGTLLVDACRHGLRAGAAWLPLVRRPVLLSLARLLGEAWPADVDRNLLIAGAFRTRDPDETHRARLRVEIGRLRRLAAPFARIEASARGFVLRPQGDAPVAVLLPPVAGDAGALLALLADGAAWSTSALAQALDASQRTVQRALAELVAAGRVRAVGRARAQRWLAPPLAGFTTILLLPAALPSG